MTDDSFTYNGIDMYEQFKIRIVAYDVLMPPLRSRKVVVPGRSGAYDYGAEYHDERTLRMSVTVDGELDAAQFDTLKYTLSRKGKIILWDKPDRQFVGQLYDPAEVLDYFRHAMREFEINFLCEPYAYALTPSVLYSTDDIIWPEYEGTRKAPTRITIRNTGSTPMQGVTITARTNN